MSPGAAATAAGVREDPAPASSATFSDRLRPAFRLDLKANTPYWRLIWGRFLFLLGIYGVQAFAQYYVRDVLQPANPLQLTGDLLATIVLSLIAFSILTGSPCARIRRQPPHASA